MYFIGVGGIGMSAIARFFAANGKQVAGYDKTPSKITKGLEKIGIKIHFTDAVKNIPLDFLHKEKTIVVYTPAIPKTHVEFNYFSQNGYIMLKRAEILGSITQNSVCLAVAGTHGKTTTSSILGHIMQPEKATAFLGGIAENYNSNLILGDDKVTVVEADEFDKSFLKLSPDIACITSMDADHLDIYGEASHLTETFFEFANKVKGSLLVAKGLPVNGLTYAVDEDADYSINNIEIVDGIYHFDVKTPTTTITNVQFQLPGKHNLMNALAALAMANEFGVDKEKIKKQLASFKGVQRRFSYKIKTEGFVLIDDYAHHPTEINAVHQSVKEMYPDEKVLVVFQPHLFSRTRDFGDDFAKALSKFDEVLLLDIYPAREEPINGITSDWLLEMIDNQHKKITTPNLLVNDIKKSSAKIVAMLGAGDIGVMIENVVESFKSPEENAV